MSVAYDLAFNAWQIPHQIRKPVYARPRYGDTGREQLIKRSN